MAQAFLFSHFQGKIITKQGKYIDEKKFFSRTTRPISPKFGKKHPWMIRIRVCSNVQMKGPALFRGEINTKKNIR